MSTSTTAALDVYQAALDGESCTVTGLGAAARTVPIARWQGVADRSDRALLAHCTSATIDLGCGPGRMAEQLARDGVSVLGVDVSPRAVSLARARGVEVERRDVLGPLPDEGRWSTALLADGNVGIGGDPVRLLRRVERLLTPAGTVVVDLAPPGTGLAVGTLRLEVRDRTSCRFPWAVVGVDVAPGVAAEAGLTVADLDASDGRWYAVLVREEVPSRCLS
jgi:SAM-dependent methyltransferase